MATGVSEGPNWVKTQLGTPIPQLPGVRLPRDGLSAWPLHVVLVVKMWGPILPAWRSPNQMGGSGWININHTLVYPQLPICQLFTEVWYMHERQNQEGLVPKGSITLWWTNVTWLKQRGKHQPWLFFNASLGRCQLRILNGCGGFFFRKDCCFFPLKYRQMFRCTSDLCKIYQDIGYYIYV